MLPELTPRRREEEEEGRGTAAAAAATVVVTLEPPLCRQVGARSVSSLLLVSVAAVDAPEKVPDCAMPTVADRRESVPVVGEAEGQETAVRGMTTLPIAYGMSKEAP